MPISHPGGCMDSQLQSTEGNGPGLERTAYGSSVAVKYSNRLIRGRAAVAKPSSHSTVERRGEYDEAVRLLFDVAERSSVTVAHIGHGLSVL